MDYLFVEAVGDGSRGWLVDDPQNLQTGNDSGILGSLALGIIEIGWHRDDSLRTSMAQIGLGSLLNEEI